jgi:TatD DNase family protein
VSLITLSNFSSFFTKYIINYKGIHNMKVVDIHCHIGEAQFDADRNAVVERMKKADVSAISVGLDFTSSKRAVELADKYENIYACVGVHPEEIQNGELDDDGWVSLLKHKKTVAIGECGFDYFRATDKLEARNTQEPIFHKHIEWAIEHKKPLMLHIRPSHGAYDAYEDALGILEQYKKGHSALYGNSHFFAGTPEIAQKFFDIGFTVSFTGVITFAKEYDEIVRTTPLNMLHAETDAPFVSPEPYRGRRNEPAFVVEVIKKIAEIRRENEESVAEVLVENARRMFGV